MLDHVELVLLAGQVQTVHAVIAQIRMSASLRQQILEYLNVAFKRSHMYRREAILLHVGYHVADVQVRVLVV